MNNPNQPIQPNRDGPPRPGQSTSPSADKPSMPRSRRGSWSLIIAATPVGAVLLLVLLVLGASALARSRLISPDSTAWLPSPQLSGSVASTTSADADLVTPSPSMLEPDELVQQLAKAKQLTLHSRLDEALALYAELALQASDHAPLEADWAWALILDGQFDQALQHARRAVELDPIHSEVVAGLARTYAKVGDLNQALAFARGAVELDPGNAEAHAVLASIYFLNSQAERAVKEAEQALSLDPDCAEARQIRGWLYWNVEGDLQRAIAELEAAVQLQPGVWLWHHELGELLIESSEYRRAATSLETALALRPKVQTYIALGKAYYGLREYDRAETYLALALADEERNAEPYAVLAAIRAAQGRCDEANPYLEQALSLDPTNALAQTTRIACLPIPSPSPVPGESPAPVSSLTGQIAFPVWNATEGGYDIYIADTDGQHRRLVAAQAHQPAFRPDGQWLAANGERSGFMNLCLIRPDGGELQEVTAYIEDALPAWSPNGQSLAFSSTRHRDRQSRLYVIDQVSLSGGRAQDRVLYTELYELLGRAPAWIDNTQIVYAGCDYTTSPVLCGLFLVSAEVGPQTPRLLTDHFSDTMPAVYGKQIVFMSNRAGNWDLYLVNAGGTGLRQLTDDPADEGLPAWAPDGTAIAFVSNKGGSWAIWMIRPDGGESRKLFNVGDQGLGDDWLQEQISWAP
ncbi:MAG: tetratricopeptide repeat protein [Anaerolineae bacterium]